MSIRQRLETIEDSIKTVCGFIKTVSIHLLEAGLFLVTLYIVGRAAWAHL
jgi:hypothetical protein